MYKHVKKKKKERKKERRKKGWHDGNLLERVYILCIFKINFRKNKMFVAESFFFSSYFPKKSRLRFCYRLETSFETFGKFHSRAYNQKKVRK